MERWSESSIVEPLMILVSMPFIAYGLTASEKFPYSSDIIVFVSHMASDMALCSKNTPRCLDLECGVTAAAAAATYCINDTILHSYSK